MTNSNIIAEIILEIVIKFMILFAVDMQYDPVTSKFLRMKR